MYGVLRSWHGPILCLAARCLAYAPGRTLRRDDRDLVETGCPQQLSVLLVGAFLPATEKHQHVEVPQGETRPLGRIGGVLRREYLLDHPQPRARRHRLAAGGPDRERLRLPPAGDALLPDEAPPG